MRLVDAAESARPKPSSIARVTEVSAGDTWKATEAVRKDASTKSPTSALSQLKIGVGETSATVDDTGNKEAPMNKKYIVRLTDEERDELAA